MRLARLQQPQRPQLRLQPLRIAKMMRRHADLARAFDVGQGIVDEQAGVRGPVENIATDPLYLDVHLNAGAQADIDLPVSRMGREDG